MMRLVGVTASDLAGHLPEVLPYIQEAVTRSNGKYQAVDIVKAIANRDMQLWVVKDDESPVAICITEIAVFPRIKVCRILACTGEGANAWVSLVREIEAWAVSQGCGAIEGITRAGWERLLKPFGYQKSHVILHKGLNT